VVGLEKVALPSFLFWQLVMRLATQTWLRVRRDSAAHEAEFGLVKGSVDRGQIEGLDGPRVCLVFLFVPCCVPPRPSTLSQKHGHPRFLCVWKSRSRGRDGESVWISGGS
jgi:hypothetical protein